MGRGPNRTASKSCQGALGGTTEDICSGAMTSFTKTLNFLVHSRPPNLTTEPILGLHYTLVPSIWPCYTEAWEPQPFCCEIIAHHRPIICLSLVHMGKCVLLKCLTLINSSSSWEASSVSLGHRAMCIQLSARGLTKLLSSWWSTWSTECKWDKPLAIFVFPGQYTTLRL